tara:strand:- start:6884 stop:8773 length:1890 start_codon:yes stop_codon:yes gene_type:complete
MKSKIFASLTFALFATFLSLALVSAASLGQANLVLPSSIDHDQGSFTFTFDLTNSGAEATIDWSESFTTGSATFTYSTNTIADGSSSTVTQPITVTATFNPNQVGPIAGSITADPSGAGSNEVIDFSIPINSAPALSLSDATITTGTTSTTMTLTNEGNTQLTSIDLTFSALTGVTFDADTIASLAPGASTDVTVDATIAGELNLDSAEVTVTATASDSTSDTAILTLENEFCSAGTIGELDIKVDINNDGRGKDDEWYLLDTITVEVTVDNDGDEKISDIVVEWSLVNQDTGEEIDNDDLNDFNLKDGKDKKLIFDIELDPDDFEAEDIGSDLVLLVKAFSDDVGEDVECISESESAELFGDDFMIVDTDSVNLPDSLQSGDTVEVRAKLWNVGSESQDEVSVRVQVEEFNFDETIEVGDMDELEDESFSFSLEIPSNARDGTYAIRFDVYDEDGEFFEDEDDDESTFLKIFDIKGGSSQASVGIVADLGSDAIAGQELVILTTITNTGDDTTTYNVIAEDYQSWASLDSIQPPTFTLEAGESREVRIVLMPNDDTSGTQEFTVQTVYSGIITEQAIEVPIQASSGSRLTGGAIGASLKENWFIWLVALINIILVILIVVVAVRMASR